MCKTQELQNSLNALADRKDIWSPAFLEFLGIEDERVLLVCANDHAVALKANLNDYTLRYEESDQSYLQNFIVSESVYEFRRLATNHRREHHFLQVDSLDTRDRQEQTESSENDFMAFPAS